MWISIEKKQKENTCHQIKNVVQFRWDHIRSMVQFHVLEYIFSSSYHFTLPEHGRYRSDFRKIKNNQATTFKAVTVKNMGMDWYHRYSLLYFFL